MNVREILPITDDFDPVDIKGWALGWFFPIADLLTMAGSQVPEHWEYAPSPMLADMSFLQYCEGEGWQAEEVNEVLKHSVDAVANLTYVGNVLDRYMRAFVIGTERDY